MYCRIFNDDVGHTTVQFKVLSTEDEWRPKHSEKPLEIFKMKDGEQQLPEGEPEIVRPNYDAVDLQDLRRSLEKDFSLAHFTEEHVREWNLFFEKTATIETETWPLHNLRPFQNVTYSSTLTEKEADILRRYKEKRHQYKQVYSSNIHGDRRRYIEGEHVVFNHTGLKRIGQIESVHEGMLTLEELQERGRKYFRTGQKERVRIEECYPGTFDLNRDSSLPRKIRSKYFA
ncbi:uncharacterized protein LOC128553705 [Mercenaria mercenaria]|uniref:uncharacterized protein LOC128553705 n=1 Tax=Mercenaria mercenaria TaxID=6596 RepID=UPI00234E91BD|nr:uncharacterized protein LOC128553705 [Mercenaria mercenaria]